MDEEYNFYDEDINKSSVVKWVILFIIIILIGGGYFGYQKYQQRKQENTNEKTLSIRDKEVTSLYHQYNIFTNSITDYSMLIQDEFFGYYYRADAYTNQTISSEIKLLTAINDLFVSETLTYTDNAEEPLEIKGEVIRTRVKQLFGEDTIYQDTSIESTKAALCQFGDIMYDEEQDLYYTEGEVSCAGRNRPILKTKLVSAQKTDHELIITEKMAYLVPDQEEEKMSYKVYDSLEDTDEHLLNTIQTEREFLFNNYTKLHEYTYHFKKQGNSYQLMKVERTK